MKKLCQYKKEEYRLFKSPEIKQKYEERFARYITAMNGGTPDRIPVRFFFQEAAARNAGLTNQQVGCDYNLAFECTRKMAEDMDSDAVMLNAIWSNYGVGKALGLRYFHVPGVDVGIDSVLQYSEPEGEEDLFMREDEYDELSDDPTGFLVNKWLSRASSRVKGLGQQVDFDHNTALIAGSMAYANYMNAFGPASARLKYESGVVSANSGMVKAPFDILADKFRGYTNLIMDCYERPEKVLKACEALMPHMVANALASADPDKNVPITLWAHRGCIPFVNREMFDSLYFATLKPVIEEIVSKGYQILFYGEGNWEAHYGDLLTLPDNTLIYHLDRGEPEKAAVLKKKFSISGGLRYDLLTRGTTEEIRSYLKGLFDVLARDGGYMLDASALMLSDIKPENVRAAVDYTLEHGVYSQGHSGKAKAVYEYNGDFKTGNRPPLTCRSWEQESRGYNNLCGDVDLVEKSWKSVDAMPYNFVWTTLLW